MPRIRNPENKGLPARWRLYHGAYYYCVPPGLEHRWDGKKQFKLGTTISEAHRTWAARVEISDSPLRTMAQLFDRYRLLEVPLKAAATQRGYIAALKPLRAVFGAMLIADFLPTDAYKYRDLRRQKAPTAANRELEVLSHCFTKAIEWGARLDHPMVEGKFRKIKNPPRSRDVTDAEVLAALSIRPRRKRGSVRVCQAYIRLKLMTGFRRTDLLGLRVPDLAPEGIRVEPSKTKHSSGKRSIREWNDKLRAVVDECLAARPVDISPWVFCNADGKGYLKPDSTANSWESVWGRFMDRVVIEAGIERFQERDLRAKCATDADSLAHAQALLDHASAATTKRIYRRRPERVKPGRGVD